MALSDPKTLATMLGVLVAALATVMAFLGWKSLRRTGNLRIGFVVVAFTFFVFKGLFSSYNVWFHTVPHDAIELVLSMFDLMIILLLFIPFFINSKGT